MLLFVVIFSLAKAKENLRWHFFLIEQTKWMTHEELEYKIATNAVKYNASALYEGNSVWSSIYDPMGIL